MSLLGINKRGKLVVGGIVAFALIATASTGLAAWVIGTQNNVEVGEGNVDVSELKDNSINIVVQNIDSSLNYGPALEYKKDGEGNYLNESDEIIMNGENPATEEDFVSGAVADTRAEVKYPVVNREDKTDVEDLDIAFSFDIVTGSNASINGVKLNLFATDDSGKTLIEAAVKDGYFKLPFGIEDNADLDAYYQKSNISASNYPIQVMPDDFATKETINVGGLYTKIQFDIAQDDPSKDDYLVNLTETNFAGKLADPENWVNKTIKDFPNKMCYTTTATKALSEYTDSPEDIEAKAAIKTVKYTGYVELEFGWGYKTNFQNPCHYFDGSGDGNDTSLKYQGAKEYLEKLQDYKDIKYNIVVEAI